MATPREVSKILTANDLGLTGSHQAGIAIPKDPELLRFFPRLDPAAYNPDYLLTVRSPQTDQYWPLRFIYYNNKVHGQGTRNEYRITGTTRMLREMAAMAGDRISFRRSPDGDIEVRIREADEPARDSIGETILRNGWRMITANVED